MATNLVTETFEGTPSGSNLALPQQELDDTEARQIMDGLVDYPGKERMRGPVTPVTGLPVFDLEGQGLAMTLNPQGVAKFAALTGDASHGYVEVLSDDLTTKVQLAWPFNLPPSPSFIVDAKPALAGGLMIGVSSAYDAANPSQGIAFWYGGNKANYANTVTFTRGSAAVTGTGFLANVAPGMFLYANTDDPYTAAYIGVVLQINSDTSLTLTAVSPYTGTAKSGTFQSLRGIAPRVTQGRITADVASTTLTGGNTKFISQGLGTGTWQIYRQSDGAFIGKVASVQTDTSLTLAANAAVAAANEAYVAVRADADFGIENTASINKAGFLNATYADRQWFANQGATFSKTARLWFSDTGDPEMLDLSSFDGNWFDVTSSSTVNEPIRGIAPAYNGLTVFKENETFIVTGTSPEDFTVRKLEDDGALSGMSIQQYAGGIIWAGREGIHFYDGIQTENLVAQKLGDYYKNTIRTFDPTTKRMWSMVDRDHYWLFIESVTPTIPIVKGVASSTPDKYAIVINLATRAVTFAENVDIRGSITLPASAGKHSWYLVNGTDATFNPPVADNFNRANETPLAAANGWGSGTVYGTDVRANLSGNVLVDPRTSWGASAVWGDTGLGPDVYSGVTFNGTFGSPNDFLELQLRASGFGGDSTGTFYSMAMGPNDIGLHKNIAGFYTALDVRTWTTLGWTPSSGDSVAMRVVGSTIELWYRKVGQSWEKLWSVIDTSITSGGSMGVAFSGATLTIDDWSVGSVPTHAWICDGEALFNQTGLDVVTCVGSSGPGPSFYWESKKFAAGDSVRLKVFKIFLLYALAQGSDLKIDVVLGLNEVGETLTKTFTSSEYTWTSLRQVVPTWTALKAQFPTWTSLVQSVFVAKRFKFAKRSTHISFRVYTAANTATRIELGPFKIGYKLMRDGRI